MTCRSGFWFRRAFPPRARAVVFSGVIGIFMVTGFLSVEATSAAPKRASAGRVQKTQMKGPKTKQKDPIHINSDKMEAYNKKNLIVFIGKVVAVQGAMEIRSDRLEVYVKKKEKTAQGAKSASAAKARKTSTGGASPAPGGGSVERLVAIGNVLVSQDKKKNASSDRLDYKESSGVAVLTGNPRAWEKNNQVVGEKIELFIREGRTVVHGSRRRRVGVTLFPESDPGQSSPKRSKGGARGK